MRLITLAIYTLLSTCAQQSRRQYNFGHNRQKELKKTNEAMISAISQGERSQGREGSDPDNPAMPYGLTRDIWNKLKDPLSHLDKENKSSSNSSDNKNTTNSSGWLDIDWGKLKPNITIADKLSGVENAISQLDYSRDKSVKHLLSKLVDGCLDVVSFRKIAILNDRNKEEMGRAQIKTCRCLRKLRSTLEEVPDFMHCCEPYSIAIVSRLV